MAGEKEFPAQMGLKLKPEMLRDLTANAQQMGTTKEVVLRELARAFNEACADGVRLVFPIEIDIVSPRYRVVGRRVEDATPSERRATHAETELILRAIRGERGAAEELEASLRDDSPLKEAARIAAESARKTNDSEKRTKRTRQ